MKKILLLLITVFCSFLYASAQEKELTNQSIMDMAEMGFSEDVIVAKIKVVKTDFDISIESLKGLKEKGVSDKIVVAMIESSNNTVENSNDQNQTENKIGIYNNQNGELLRIHPSVFSGSKTNTLGSALSYGLASSTIKSVINNPTSINVVNSNMPEFIFFFAGFNNQEYRNSTGNWWFLSATSPSEFVLVKLEKRGKTREMKTGSVNIYAGTNIGIDENSIIPFDIVGINDHSFKVTPVDPLESGEYCFFYQGEIPQGGYNNQSVFDFSVPNGNEIPAKYTIGSIAWTLIKGKPKRCDVIDVKLKRDGIYYELIPHLSGANVIRIEKECYATKQELLQYVNSTE